MADNARPPFRADHVGSLLRPKEVLQARDEFAKGAISAEQLARVEDDAIRDAIRMQGEVGLKSATDGEMRRQSWHMDFIYQLGGIEQVNDDLVRVAFHNKDKSYEYAPPSAHVKLPRELELESMRAMDDYLDGKQYRITTPYEGALQHGHVYLADVRALHQTVRHRSEGVRVSIDFRFRTSDRVYREMAPVVHGPESGDSRVPYADWLAIGTDSLVAFDEPISQARERAPDADDRPFGLPYRIIELGS